MTEIAGIGMRITQAAAAIHAMLACILLASLTNRIG
jgi:hypothetical protein